MTWKSYIKETPSPVERDSGSERRERNKKNGFPSLEKKNETSVLLQLIEKLINKPLKNVEKAAAATAADGRLMQAHASGENVAVVVAAAAIFRFVEIS